jgi:hypothetical protein
MEIKRRGGLIQKRHFWLGLLPGSPTALLRHVSVPNTTTITATAARTKKIDDPQAALEDWVELWLVLVAVAFDGPPVTEELDDAMVVVVTVVVMTGGKGRPGIVVRRRTVKLVAPELPRLSASPP